MGELIKRPKVFLIFLCLIIGSHKLLYGQKKLIDSAAITNWPLLRNQAISGNGNFFSYALKRGTSTTWKIMQIDRSWEKSYDNLKELFFSDDSRWLYILTSTDSLKIIDLQSKALKFTEKVSFFKSFNRPNSIIAYSTESGNNLIISNLSTGEKKEMNNVADQSFSDNGEVILLEDMKSHKLTWFETSTFATCDLGYGSLKNSVFDNKSNQLAFFGYNSKEPSIYIFKKGNATSTLLLDSNTSIPDECNLSVGGIFFSNDNSRLFFYCKKKQANPLKANTVKNLSLWYQTAERPISATTPEEESKYLFSCSLIIPNAHPVRIQQKFDQQMVLDGNNQEYAASYTYDPNNSNLRAPYNTPLTLISCIDGSRKILDPGITRPSFSPKSKYLIGYHLKRRCFVFYETEELNKTAYTPKFSHQITVKSNLDNSSNPRIAAWDKGDRFVFIYDDFDIWRIDPISQHPPLNLTQGWGKRHKTKLRWTINERMADFPRRPGFAQAKLSIILPNDTLLLSAFNDETKQMSAMQLVISNFQNGSLTTLTTNQFYFDAVSKTDLGASATQNAPLKAKYVNRYLVFRMRSTDYPNLYVTDNFKSFSQLTYLQPQLEYNWYNCELINFSVRHKSESALLYKPENFDPSKRYPIIFYYYERNSHLFNSFLHPIIGKGPLPINWFVSRGYVVCIPDITYKKGEIGESAYLALNSVVNILAKSPWVDTKHLGLQGHSFGGFETNYIVTRTSRFAAAASTSGLSDFISFYNSSGNVQPVFEYGQPRMGATLWQDRQHYIKESPVFEVDKVNTPLLITHNEGDTNVPITQSIEFFKSLKRLNKQVWLLNYTNEGHTIENFENSLDYTNKMTDFFDYYLKQMPAQDWMGLVKKK